MKINKFIRQEFDFLTELFYPRICMSCGRLLIKEEDILCTYCIMNLPKTNYHLWKRNPVMQLFDGRINLNAATAMYFYKKGGNVQQLLHNFKYRGYSDIGVKTGKDFGSELMLSAEFKTADYIIPVPLHFKKLRIRGFNQSERFAFGLSQSMSASLENDNLIRKVHTSTQTKKSRWERWQNVNSIFELKNPEKLKDSHVLLVDDVITTGSTIEGCVTILSRVEGIKISVAAMASPAGV
jgi:ComF family protein